MDVLVRRLVVDASGDALLSLVVQHTIGGAPARQELTVIVLVVTLSEVRSGQVRSQSAGGIISHGTSLGPGVCCSVGRDMGRMAPTDSSRSGLLVRRAGVAIKAPSY